LFLLLQLNQHPFTGFSCRGGLVTINSFSMYRDQINSPDQALVHLAFHCSLKDGELHDAELDVISSAFVAKGLNKELDFKKEMQNYQSYYKDIRDETGYLIFLIQTISPKYRLALFAFCAEIINRDGNISLSEEVLLNKIAGLLYVKDQENIAVQHLIAELNAVEKGNTF
jgi:uncharacterized tellurite resistance protein B-like protein